MSYVLTHPTSSNCDHSYSILSGYVKPNEPSPDYMNKFDGIICDFLREQGVPGASLYITLHGKPIYKQGYGMSGCGELVSSSSHFRIASISKVLTAVAILRMCEDGQLHLNQKVFCEYGILRRMRPGNIKQMEQFENITVQDLLQHSGGWDRDLVGDHVFWYQKEEHRSKLDVWNNEKLLRYVLTHDLSFKPGVLHAYSNFGYLILGLIIEQITGMAYEDYVKTLVREIGIEDISVGKTTQDKVHNQEVKYFNNKDPLVEMSVFNSKNTVVPQYGSFTIENTGAFGGWVTCGQNLVTLLDSLLMMNDLPSVLSQQSVSLMLAAPRFADGDAWYGLGLDIEDAGSSFGHTGAMEGTSTTLHHNMNGLTWALLLNSWSKDMDLDGLIKYALSSIHGLPMWQGPDVKCLFGDYCVMSEDELECVRILLPHEHFLPHVMDMKSRGYEISWINALSLTDDVNFNIIWRKQTDEATDWAVIIDVELIGFNDCLKKMKENWRVTALESYYMGSEIYHLFVFQRSISAHQKVYVVEGIEHHKRFHGIYEKSDYQLQTQSVLQINEAVFISAVYDKVNKKIERNGTNIWLDLSMEDYVGKLAKSIEDGRFLRYIQFYSTDDMPNISAVWYVSTKDNNVFQRHDVTKYGFLFELGESMKCNRPVSFLSAYMHEDVIYFAAVWETKVRVPRYSYPTVDNVPGQPNVQIEDVSVPEFQNVLSRSLDTATVVASAPKKKRSKKKKISAVSTMNCYVDKRTHEQPGAQSQHPEDVCVPEFQNIVDRSVNTATVVASAPKKKRSKKKKISAVSTMNCYVDRRTHEQPGAQSQHPEDVCVPEFQNIVDNSVNTATVVASASKKKRSTITKKSAVSTMNCHVDRPTHEQPGAQSLHPFPNIVYT